MTSRLESRRRLAVAVAALLLSPTSAVPLEAGSSTSTDTAVAAAASPSSAPGPAALAVYPGEVDLSSADDFQGVLVLATFPDGSTRDVTDDAALQLSDLLVATLDGAAVRPRNDGACELRADYAGVTAAAAIRVRGAHARREIGFRADVIPALTAGGCNSGACHGSARGQDGFLLSLFGFDPAADHHRITRELGTRRVNLALPRESLLVKKALGEVPHTGGRLFSEDDPRCQAILRWLERGAPDDAADVVTPVALEVFPPGATLSRPGETARAIARARYSDGTDRDVTHLSVFRSSDDSAASIAADGRVVAVRPGEAFLTARFHTFTVGTPVIVRDPERRAAVAAVEPFDDLDVPILDKLRRLRIDQGPLCDDETFVRRIHLDVVGLPPTPEERARFLADERPDRRDRLIDELLQRGEFTDLWVMKWSELLQVRTDPQAGQSHKSMVLYGDWLRDRLEDGVPLDELVRELLTATGSTFENPAANFYQVERDTLKLAENVTQSLLGMRIQCAQCHNHPFDRWTMDDYYGFAAFFAQVGRKGTPDPRERVIFDARSGEVKHPVRGRDVAPKFLGGATPDLAGRDRRAVLAEWLTAADNPFFARNLANIVWSHFFGRGVVEPVDDVRITNPPSNDALLEHLAAALVASDFDLRALVRDICRSRTYQLASAEQGDDPSDERDLTRAPVRRLRAEVLLDAIAQVTETGNRFDGVPGGGRAAEIADGAITNDFLTTFGRATRTTVCSCEVVVEPNLSQALHLINGDNVHQRIQQGGVVRRALEAGRSPAEVVEDLYLRCYSRAPTEDEAAALAPLLAEADDAASALEDLFWALLNSREFLFNH